MTTIRKKVLCAAAAFCTALVLTGCGLLHARIDTSAWEYHAFEESGIAIMLPDDLKIERMGGSGYCGQSSEVQLEIEELDELYSDLEGVAAAERTAEQETEIVSLNNTELVQAALPDSDNTAIYYRLNARGDLFRIRVHAYIEDREKRSKALLTAITDTICDREEVPSDTVTNHPAPPAKAEIDKLVLVNQRNSLPEGWAEGLDLVRTSNTLGETVWMERAACKAFFGLRGDLAQENTEIDMRSAYEGAAVPQDGSEHPTGLACDLYPVIDGVPVLDRTELLNDPEVWEKIHEKLSKHGFILRYPEGGEYYTGNTYEPWHIRYVGEEAATEIAERGITLEEYLGNDPASIDYLVLVNPHNALPASWEDRIELAAMTNRHGETIEVERIAYDAYLRLREALLPEGVHLDINSAYRSVRSQEALVKSFTEKYGKGYVEQYVAVPGYSEHHTGLAIDLYLESQAVWSKIHAKLAAYGFILRYPEGKENLTGYGYEPWHIRYVGLQAAKDICEQGVTLEEYLGAA